ncbi:AI-2E family transporter [Caballeronia sp. LZ016]|uniref:AI-2E family transporter n=1 Tax=Caballeronia sp. LZ016 TaxID=3038554 RepID=UPI00285A5B90|nr:AI-2E family transporter [Caballeronia sp. LZ016]MDR5740939.1 AI-2E family transporter [Caballeronia sp. LZ016]
MLHPRPFQRELSRELLDVLIRVGLIAVLAVFCFRIFAPFLNLMIWALILAVTLYPLQTMLRRRFGGRDGLAATLIVLVAFAVVLAPTCLLALALADSVEHALAVIRSDSIHIPPPDASVAKWPLIGQRVFDFWLQASTDLVGVLRRFAPELRVAGRTVLGTVTGFGAGLVIFFVALIVAGIVMAHGEKGHRNALQIASRISGADNGPRIVELCTKTIRAVAQGVVGIAFIQTVLIGAAFVLMKLPGAGLLALAVLLIGIMQLPATLVTGPVIVFVIVTDGLNAATIVFSVYVFIAGLVDNVLKPLLLGRGVSVPMPVVLIGALGGMVTSGVIGLFIGPVMLAVGYQLFWRWVRQDREAVSAAESSGP